MLNTSRLSVSDKQVYFDCNATTPTLPQAAHAALETMRSVYGNPSSVHTTGLQAKFILETTRQNAARCVGALPQEITFTSGATEGIQTAIFSALQHVSESVRQAKAGGVRCKLLYGATEHKAVPQALQHWNQILGLDFDIVALPVNTRGELDLTVLTSHLKEAALLCTMAANNETGVIHDLKAIEACLQKTNPDCLWLVDCVQGLGKIPLNFSQMRVDYAAFSGHKLYAPKGIGFLYVRTGAPLVPLIVGGGQERGARSGTENLPGVAALGEIISALVDPTLKRPIFQTHATLVAFRARIATALKAAFPEVVFNAPFDNAIPTTLNFSVPGFESRELLDLFDAAGVRLSAGSACSAAKAQASHVLDAMGVPQWASESALRLSIGLATTAEEVDRGCLAIAEAAAALRQSCVLLTAGDFIAPPALVDGVIQLKHLSANTWILVNAKSRQVIIIDPVDETSQRVIQFVQCQNLKVAAILDTHSHGDHVSCRLMMERILASHMLWPAADRDELGWPEVSAHSADLAESALTEPQFVTLANGFKAPCLVLGPSESPDSQAVLAWVHTPGHTADARCYLYGSRNAVGLMPLADTLHAFCGDTILSGGLGRSNFESSSTRFLHTSLNLLSQLVANTTLLCPSHDYDISFATTLKAECRLNPLLALALNQANPFSEAEFVLRKDDLDLGLAGRDQESQGIVCGMIASPTAGAHSTTGDGNVALTPCQLRARQLSIGPGQLADFLAQNATNTVIVDVREPHEFSLSCGVWRELGFLAEPRNVPLSRFVNLMAEVLRLANQGNHGNHVQRQNYILFCRSGARSEYAVKTLRRLGIEACWNVDGGVAYGCSTSLLNTKNAAAPVADKVEDDVDFVI